MQKYSFRWGMIILWAVMLWGWPVQAAQRWAVIIGIARYQDSRFNLAYTTNDAKAIFHLLRAKGGIPEQNMLLLLDEQATRSAISDVFCEWLPKRVAPGDLVLIYYSGHGLQGLDLPPADEADHLDEYLAPYNLNFLTAETIADTGIRDDMFAEWLQNLPSTHVVIFDSCYSGSGIKGKLQGTPKTPFALLSRTKGGARAPAPTPSASEGMQKELSDLVERVTFLAASQPHQVAVEYDDFHHSFFTYYFLEGLYGKADHNGDGQIWVSEAFPYAAQQMAKDQIFPQQPFMQSEKDIVLVANSWNLDAESKWARLWFEILAADGTTSAGIEHGEYPSGTMMNVFFQVDRSCYFFVFNIDQEGNVYPFYPAEPGSDASVWVEHPQQPYSVKAQLDNVVGKECFYAVASLQPFSFRRHVLPAVQQEFRTKGLLLEQIPLLPMPYSYAKICFTHR